MFSYCNIVPHQAMCNSVRVTQSNSTQSDDCSSRAVGEEDIETAKSELRLGMKCILH